MSPADEVALINGYCSMQVVGPEGAKPDLQIVAAPWLSVMVAPPALVRFKTNPSFDSSSASGQVVIATQPALFAGKLMLPVIDRKSAPAVPQTPATAVPLPVE